MKGRAQGGDIPQCPDLSWGERWEMGLVSRVVAGWLRRLLGLY